MTRIEVNNVHLNYEESGSGETVVLVHGGWSDRNNWLPVVAGLSDAFRIVAIDRRCHGLSQRGVPGTRRDQEDDLAGLIESLGDEPVSVVGTSFGGSIAIGLASRRPDLVRSVVAHEPPLISVAADDPKIRPQLEAVEETVRAVLGLIERGNAVEAAERFVEEVALGPGAWAMLPEPIRLVMVDGAPAFAGEQTDPAWASVGPDALASVECPALITEGTVSPSWFQPIVARLTQAIGSASVHRFEGAGHAPHLTHPDDYVTAITGFLSSVSERETENAMAAA